MPPEKLLDMLGPLVGVVVGGLVTYLVTTAGERRRWAQQKRDRLSEARRKAVDNALSWLDPMDLTLAKVQMLVGSLLEFNIDNAQFLADFPRLVSTLAKMDVPSGERLLLPKDAYRFGVQIINAFDRLQATAISWANQGRMEQRPWLGFHEVGKDLDAIRNQIDQLRTLLRDAYLDSFK